MRGYRKLPHAWLPEQGPARRAWAMVAASPMAKMEPWLPFTHRYGSVISDRQCSCAPVLAGGEE